LKKEVARKRKGLGGKPAKPSKKKPTDGSKKERGGRSASGEGRGLAKSFFTEGQGKEAGQEKGGAQGKRNEPRKKRNQNTEKL